MYSKTYYHWLVFLEAISETEISVQEVDSGVLLGSMQPPLGPQLYTWEVLELGWAFQIVTNQGKGTGPLYSCIYQLLDVSMNLEGT